MFFLPNAPIAFGHIYLAYTKAYLINQTEPSSKPEYICYNETLCDGFEPKKGSVLFNNTNCRRPQNFDSSIFFIFQDKDSLCYYINWIKRNLHHCNTIPRNVSFICDNSTMYQCINSSKCIAKTRLNDDLYDCDYQDDETSVDIMGNCPMKISLLYFHCIPANICISRKSFANGVCDCMAEGFFLCEDEIIDELYPVVHIAFPHICNHVQQFGPILIDGMEHTDESECEQWPCHNIYTRCNGILDCQDGIDEFDCHPLSLINCSLRSFVCFSSQTSDYICLSLGNMNDGNIDCIGGIDEAELCQRYPTTTSEGRFYCKTVDQPKCLEHSLLCNDRSRCLNRDDTRFCHHLENRNIFEQGGICDNDDMSVRSDTEEFLCNHFKSFYEGMTYFSLGRITKKEVASDQRRHEEGIDIFVKQCNDFSRSTLLLSSSSLTSLAEQR